MFATIASESLRYLGVPGEKLIPRDAEGHALITMDGCGTPLADAQGNWIPAIRRSRLRRRRRLRAAPLRRRPTTSSRRPMPSTVPDFRGMGVGRALDLAREQHLAVEIAGTGRVISQDPPPGPRPAQPVHVKLQFSDDARRSFAPRSLTLASLHEIGEAARSIGMTLRQLIEGLAGARLVGDGERRGRARVHDDSRRSAGRRVRRGARACAATATTFAATADRAGRRGGRRRARAAEREGAAGDRAVDGAKALGALVGALARRSGAAR